MAIEKIKGHLLNNNNFLLSGGAGSGKTYTLIQTLDAIFEDTRCKKVACITYTNVATKEILERNPYANLSVSTIHEFLWEQIKNFQINLKESILVLLKNNTIKHNDELTIDNDLFKDKKIEYREYRKLEEGIISHDEVIKVSHYMFNKFRLLCRITNDKFNYIFIDEYQDTQKEVVEIFLNYLQQCSNRCVVGLFGDSMQSIYTDGVGDIKSYIKDDLVKEVVKDDNRRCAVSVINLLNKIRNDLNQKPANNNKDGCATFLYSTNSSITIDDIKANNHFKHWDFSDIKNNKVLYLTHKLIAKEQGFSGLVGIFNNDDLTGDSPNKFIAHLLQIEEIISLYENKKYNEFLKKTYFQLNTLSDKQVLNGKINNLKNTERLTIEDVLNLADQLELIKKDDQFNDYTVNNHEKYETSKIIKYSEIRALFKYRDGLSPYSTQHGVKGAEFNNVLVILDNGKWNQYNFNYLFENTANKESVIERTKKIFYVTCSRTKDRLTVFYPNPTDKVLQKAKEWFGDDNVYTIDTK